jgi:vacuolar-type H+-ATPase catalytic subunit A/Vma1
MAKELETTQMVQLLSMTPQGSPAFFVILTSIFENSSLSNRQQLVQAIQQMMQPNPEEQQVKQIEMQKSMLELEELKAEINKIYAEAQKLQVESGDKTSNETLAKKQLELAEKMVKIKGIQSETARNVPEVDHLNSETVLNLSKAMNG